MNSMRSVLLPAAVAAVLLGGLAAPAWAKEEVLIDFADVRKDPDGTVLKHYEYTYQDWGSGHVIDLAGKGALVKSKSGRGGLGENKTMVKFDKTPVVELVFVIGTANQAKGLSMALTDKDGTEHQWQIPFAGKSPGQTVHHKMDLTKRDQELKPGKTPGLDLKKIVGWQVRGDSSAPNVEVLLVKLTGQK